MVWVVEVHEGPALDDTKLAVTTMLTAGTSLFQMSDED